MSSHEISGGFYVDGNGATISTSKTGGRKTNIDQFGSELYTAIHKDISTQSYGVAANNITNLTTQTGGVARKLVAEGKGSGISLGKVNNVDEVVNKNHQPPTNNFMKKNG